MLFNILNFNIFIYKLLEMSYNYNSTYYMLNLGFYLKDGYSIFIIWWYRKYDNIVMNNIGE